MSRFPRFAVLLVVAVLVVVAVSPVLAQVEVKKVGEGGQPATPGAWQYQGLYVPGYWQLSQPGVQKEIELLPEQLEKLKELSKRYYEAQREDAKAYGDWSKMTDEERKAKYKEVSERAKQRTEDLRKEVEKVLIPSQIEALRDLNLRTYGQYMLMQPRIMEAVGLNEEQKTKLQKLREEFTQKQQQLQKEMMDEQFKLLTPEQKERLKEEMQKQWRGY